MKQHYYQAWLLQQEYPEKTIHSRMSNARRVEEHYGDLDASFDQDGLESLIALFRYSADDARQNKPNPTTLPVNGDLRTNLSTYRNAIGLYQKFRQETAGIIQPVPSEPTPIQAKTPPTLPKTKFGLERDMQILLRRNIHQLEAGLEIIDDGAERKVDTGFIDITARDPSGTIVVIELKRDIAGQSALTQVLSYMSNIREEEGDTPVRGMLVAAGFDKKVTAALREIRGDVSLKSYAVTFSFTDEPKD